jgi:hypothetical protein
MRFALLTGVVAVYMAGCAGSPGEGGAQTGGGAKLTLPQKFDRLDAVTRTMPRDGFDPDAVAARVGDDPAALLIWVQQHTTWVPYRGALRGPSAVLMDGAGNDLDRSLLLARLVSRGGRDVRLVHVVLTDDQANERLTRVASQGVPSSAPPAGQGMAEVDARVTAGVASLAANVGTTVGAGPDAAQLDAAHDHWWVQQRKGGADWTDLDLAAPKGGAHLGGDPGSPIDCTANACNVPDNLFHKVVFRVVVERWADGNLAEDVAVESTVRAWDAPGQHVVLVHDTVPVGGAAPPDARKAWYLTQKAWRPVLVVNGQPQRSHGFDASGRFEGAAPAARPAPAGGGLGLGLGALGGGSSSPAPAKASPSVLTAEWLDIGVVVPGSGSPTTTVTRREVFDSIGPAARAKGGLAQPSYDERKRIVRGAALSGASDNLVVSSAFTMEYVAGQVTSRLLAARGPILAAAGDRTKPESRATLTQYAADDPLRVELFAVARSYAGHPATFLDRPNVVRLVVADHVGADGALLPARVSDLAVNHVATLAPSGQARFTESLRRGVADTEEEAIVAGVWPPTKDDSAAANGTGAVFRRALAAHVPLVSLHGGGDAKLANIHVSDDVRQRITADLAAGQLVVIPASVPSGARIGWWRVDAATGSTVGVMDDGGRQDMSEQTDLSPTVMPGKGLDLGFQMESRLTMYPQGGSLPPNWAAIARERILAMGLKQGSMEWLDAMDAIVDELAVY